MAHLVKRRKEWKKKELREHKANFLPVELNLEIIQKCHMTGLFLFPKIIHACAYLPTSPLQSHPTWLGDETKLCKWVLVDLFITSCALPWYLSLPFGTCTALWFIYTASHHLLKTQSVGQAGEHLGVESTGCSGIILPSCQVGLLLPLPPRAERQKPAEAERQREDGPALWVSDWSFQENKTCSHLISGAWRVFTNVWSRLLEERVFRAFYTYWRQMRSFNMQPGTQTTTSARIGIWKL